jgi:predicted ferric reductase
VTAPPIAEVRHPDAWHRVPGAVWIAAYLLLAAFPLLLLLAGPVPRGGGRWWDFSMGLGFAGLALMGLQFVLTARFRRIFAPFGVDILYWFHRWMAVGGVALVVGHYLVIRILYPDTLGPADPRDAPGHLTAGRLSLLLLLALVVSSLWRRPLRLPYDGWRIAHAAMAVAAVILAIVHVHGVGHYTLATWKGPLWLAYSGLWVALVLHVRLLKPFLLARHPYVVKEVRPERGRAWSVTLAPVTGPRLAFRPGQFAWLSLGSHPVRMSEHPFSFSGSADEPDLLRFTIKELGDFTRTIGQIPPGTTAYVDGPYGAFSVDLHPKAAGFVFVAGGVGVAPMMSTLRTLADRGDRRPLVLFYGSARWNDTLFREELADLRTRLDLRVVHALEEPSGDPAHETGYLTEELLRRHLPETARDWPCFLCGPKAMTDSVLPSLRRLGFPLRHLHTELFEMA